MIRESESTGSLVHAQGPCVSTVLKRQESGRAVDTGSPKRGRFSERGNGGTTGFLFFFFRLLKAAVILNHCVDRYYRTPALALAQARLPSRISPRRFGMREIT